MALGEKARQNPLGATNNTVESLSTITDVERPAADCLPEREPEPMTETDPDEAISDQEWADLCGVVLGEVDPEVALTRWQESVLAQCEEDLESGVAWHPAVRDADVPVAKKQTATTLRAKIQRDVASWFVQSNNQFIKVDNGAMRYGYAEMEKLLPQMIAERYDVKREAIMDHRNGCVSQL
jgi:hypothetical protein